MLGAVCLDVGVHRDEVLQTWLSENADVGSQMVLHSQSEGGGELPWRFDGSLVISFRHAIYIVIGVQRRMDRYLCH